jgi:hypothetical protein
MRSLLLPCRCQQRLDRAIPSRHRFAFPFGELGMIVVSRNSLGRMIHESVPNVGSDTQFRETGFEGSPKIMESPRLKKLAVVLGGVFVLQLLNLRIYPFLES